MGHSNNSWLKNLILYFDKINLNTCERDPFENVFDLFYQFLDVDIEHYQLL